jgi:hypothetical protein
MNNARRALAGCAIASLIGVAAVQNVWAQAQPQSQSQPQSQPQAQPHAQQTPGMNELSENAEGPVAQTVRQSTAQLRDVTAAQAAGYALAGGCVSAPEEGAMGVHYVNAALLADGMLDVGKPETLVYEPRDGQLQLVAVEYMVMAAQWDAANEHPPVLHGQHFHYVPSPNRTGLDAYYELHVWAWKRNPHGTFADWNPRVRCDSYNPQ